MNIRSTSTGWFRSPEQRRAPLRRQEREGGGGAAGKIHRGAGYDDGRGFDPARSRGMGILGMEERVKRLGGTLRVESQPGEGATVMADLPIPAGGAA